MIPQAHSTLHAARLLLLLLPYDISHCNHDRWNRALTSSIPSCFQDSGFQLAPLLLNRLPPPPCPPPLGQQGVVTGLLMILSPTLFERMGWKGVASTTPWVLLWGGLAFFISCMAYQLTFAPGALWGSLSTVPAALISIKVRT